MDPVASILLLNSLILGFRHGIDWDHLAAIIDIVGTTTSSAEGGLPRRALRLSALYVLGHALVLTCLGLAAISFAAVLPQWVDGLMQRLVGITLLVLGAWVLYSLTLFVTGKSDSYPASRWMLVFGAIRRGVHWLEAKIARRPAPVALPIDQYGARTAFGVGMIHGIGAETGTQVLLLVAVAGAGNHEIGLAMLLSFIVGLVVSNMFVAMLGISGFTRSVAVKPLYVSFSLASALFGLAVGALYASGNAGWLPDLHR